MQPHGHSPTSRCSSQAGVVRVARHARQRLRAVRAVADCRPATSATSATITKTHERAITSDADDRRDDVAERRVLAVG